MAIGLISGPGSNILTFSEEWPVLGPFQIGTREAPWGADPLEFYGGFNSLEYNKTTSFKSSLAFNGTVLWSTAKSKITSSPQLRSTSADLSFSFDDVDWRSLQDVYGWAALQWQGWARGEFFVPSGGPEVHNLYTEHILEFWIDDQPYFGGDFYGYGHVPVTLRLKPGNHKIDIRLVRDVRAMGGVGVPNVDVTLRLEASEALLQPRSPGGLDHPFNLVLMSDVAGDDWGIPGSPYASVTVRNDAQRDIHVLSIEAERNKCEAELLNAPVKLVPGQSRPLSFQFGCIPPMAGRGRVPIDFKYRVDGEDKERTLSFWSFPVSRALDQPQKLTYMHPAGMVSYAILRPPSEHAKCGRQNNEKLPILLQFHGAGLEADSDQVKHALDSLPNLCAWVLFPTGVTPWSSDDWHQFGFTDVEAAVAAIPDWIERVGWTGPGVDIDRWLVSGHSNGGQGTWYGLTHRPDKVIAAAPVSGYSSIQNYVPYSFWYTADPGRTAVVQSTLNSYRHELLLENVKDIPILQQHGSADDNVPPYHSRMLSQRVQQAGADSEYVEIQGKPHFWDGVMTTKPLSEFYRKHLNMQSVGPEPINFNDFTVVSAHTGDMGSKHGVEILEILTPGNLAKIQITFDPLTSSCAFHTSNVRRFALPSRFDECSPISVDGQQVPFLQAHGANSTFLIEEGRWNHASTFPILTGRQGRQLGPMDSILRTEGAFSIVHHSTGAEKVALQISRNLCQYFAADTLIHGDYDAALASTSNIISLALGSDLPTKDSRFSHPIRLFNDRVEIEDINNGLRSYPAMNGLAAIFLRPLPGQRLELVVWGVDMESLTTAARLVPMMTGTGQPDFVIADRTVRWKGLEGTLALGFFNTMWKVSRNSYLS